MNAHAALRAIRNALQGHKLGPGPRGSAKDRNAALARAEALIERLRGMAEEVDTVVEDPFEDPTALARVRVVARVTATKLREELKRRPR